MVKLLNVSAQDFEPILADLGVDPAAVQLVDPAPPPPSEHKPLPTLRRAPLLFGQIGAGLEVPRAAKAYRQRGEPVLPQDAPALFFLKDLRTDEELARWRNHLWPWLHVVAIYRLRGGAIERQTLHGRERLEGRCERQGVVIAGHRREQVLSPGATRLKFDRNAGGWNGPVGGPGYAHFRWMRRYVGRFARPAPGARVLDFGCGAGWVGIEAALYARDVTLCAFDPSPEMVRLAEQNARASGVERFEGRTGFGDAPPFPAAGEAPFDVVYSSGVVSFAPDAGRFADGLVAAVKPGGLLVVGDIHRDSRGMRRRRATRPLLPVREMNALTRDEMRALLEQRGCKLEAEAGYQLTWPVPQAMHWSDTRAKGLLTPPLLLANKLSAGNRLAADRFDSWVLRLRRGS